LKDEELLKELEDVKSRFTDIHQFKIKYVMFPYTEDGKLQKRFATIANKAGLTAVGHSIYLGLEHSKAKAAIAQNLYYAQNNAYIALLEGNAADQEATLKFYKERMDKGDFKAVSMTTCLSGTPKQNGNKHGISSKLIIGKAKANGGKHQKTHHHKKTHCHKNGGKKHSDKRGRKEKTAARKQGVLVNPGLIRGFKKAHTGATKKQDKLVDSVDQKHINGQKMHAKQNKDFEMNNPEPIELKANALKNKDDEAKKDGAKEADKKGDEKDSAAVSLSAGTTTLVMTAVAGLVAFL